MILSSKIIDVWKPLQGESLVGTIIGRQLATGIYNVPALLIQEQSEVVFALEESQWIQEQGLKSGDLVAITFMGKIELPKQIICNNYQLIVDRSESLLTSTVIPHPAAVQFTEVSTATAISSKNFLMKSEKEKSKLFEKLFGRK
jgi:hypothetical protein